MTTTAEPLEIVNDLQRQIFAGAAAGATRASISAGPGQVVYEDNRPGRHLHQIDLDLNSAIDFMTWTSAISLYPAPDGLQVTLSLTDTDYHLERDLLNPRQGAVDVSDIQVDDTGYRLHLVNESAYLLPTFMLVRPDGTAGSSRTVPRGFPIYWSENREPGALVHTAFHAFIVDQDGPGPAEPDQHDRNIRDEAGRMLFQRMLELMAACDGDVWVSEEQAHHLPELPENSNRRDVVFYSTADDVVPNPHLPSEQLIGTDQEHGYGEYLLQALSPILAPEKLLVRDLGKVLPVIQLRWARATETDGTVTELPLPDRREAPAIERTRIISVRDVTLGVEFLSRGDLATPEGRNTLTPVEQREYQVDFYAAHNGSNTLLMVREDADVAPERIELLLSRAPSPEEYSRLHQREWFWSYHVRRLIQGNRPAAAHSLRAVADSIASAEVELDPADGDLTVASADGRILITVRAN